MGTGRFRRPCSALGTVIGVDSRSKPRARASSVPSRSVPVWRVVDRNGRRAAGTCRPLREIRRTCRQRRPCRHGRPRRRAAPRTGRPVSADATNPSCLCIHGGRDCPSQVHGQGIPYVVMRISALSRGWSDAPAGRIQLGAPGFKHQTARGDRKLEKPPDEVGVDDDRPVGAFRVHARRVIVGFSVFSGGCSWYSMESMLRRVAPQNRAGSPSLRISSVAVSGWGMMHRPPCREGRAHSPKWGLSTELPR